MCESVMGNKEYWQTFLKQLRQDYHTPRFKTEVVFDTLLLPEIVEDLVGAALGYAQEERGKVKFIVKEFPIRTFRLGKRTGKEDNRTFCVDYLLSDGEKMYLVELKTDTDSFKREQLEKYEKVVNDLQFTELYEKDYLVKILENNKKKYAEQAKRLKECQEKFSEKFALVYIMPESESALKERNITCIALDKIAADEKQIFEYKETTREFLKIWQYVTKKEMKSEV